MRNPETASIIERLIACRDTLKVVEGQFAVNLQPERAVMADAANALDAYDKTMQRIAEAPSPTPPAGDGWEPIETAPKDGTTILVWSQLYGGVAVLAYWDSDKYAKTPKPFWATSSQRYVGKTAERKFPPTHWRPLPPPPVSKGEK